MAYDVVIRNGTIVDGSGLVPFRADVGIVADRITKIGRITSRGSHEVDADGHVVTPGFIDGHAHMDAQVFWDPLGSSSFWHGVTTVVMGNCGFTLAPAARASRHLAIINLERSEDISRAAIESGIDWSWESFPEYLDAVESVPKAINYASHVGHSALRAWAMGERAFEEPATDGDLDRMATALREAIVAGAAGFSTSSSVHHSTSDDRPVASRLASWDEVRSLVGVLGDLGSGVFEVAVTQRGEPSTNEQGMMENLRCLAVESGVPITFSVMPDDEGAARLALIEAAALDGGIMYGQTSSLGFHIVLSFLTQLPFDKLPEWEALRSRPVDEQKHLLSDAAFRSRLVEIASTPGVYGQRSGHQARVPNYELIDIFDQPLGPHRSVADVARAQNVNPVELMIDLALEKDFHQYFLQGPERVDEDRLLSVMRHPRTVMTFSDTGAHVSQILGGSLQTHLLAYWVREKQAISLEEAIRMVTLVPARIWNFHDRGLLREGMVADVNVLDPATVGPRLPSVVYDLPDGGKRLEQRAQGIRATVVSGKIVSSEGEPTGVTPGRLLRSTPNAC